MNAAVTLRFPPESAEKLGLELSPDGACTLSWIELAFRLTQATGKPELANAETVRRGVTGCWYARVAAKAVLARPDWQAAAWQSGLLVLFDRLEEIEQAYAACFLESFFLAVFTQPQRYLDLAGRQVRSEHVAGWATTLSLEDLSGLAGAADERRNAQAEPDGWHPTVLSAALDLYLRWTGQVKDTPAAPDTAERQVLPIPGEP